MEYFREGRTIYRRSQEGRKVRVATARSRVGAALTIKILSGEISGDWRKYLKTG